MRNAWALCAYLLKSVIDRWDDAVVVAGLAIDGADSSRVRTTDEYRRLLEAAGLVLADSVPTLSSLTVLEARAIG